MHGEEAVNTTTVRIIKHEAIPGCGKFRGSIPRCAREQAKAVARAAESRRGPAR